jgi:TonB family protein
MEKLLVECLVRSTLIALCAAAGLFAMGIRGARVRHGVWTGVMASMLVLPVWSVWGPTAVLHVLTPAPAVAAPTIALDQGGAIVSMAPIRPAFWTAEKMLIAVWLLGALVLLSRLVTGTIRTNRLRRLGGDGLVTPITVGWLRPSIILPAGWRDWPERQLQAVMAHEQEHARRRDPLVQWLALFNRAVFWFHPLAWWLERRLAGLSEEACDDAVLMNGHDPLEYSELLLGLARAVREAGARVEVVGMAMPGTFLPERIRRIAGGAKVQRISGMRMAGLVLFFGAAAMLCAAGSIGYRATPAAAVAKAEPAMIRQQADTPVLTAQAVAPGMSLHGSVFDPANLPVSGAPIALTNTGSKATLTTTTNDRGEYRFAGIAAGTYDISVRVPGFKAATQTGLHMTVGENRDLGKMLLQVGQVSESLTIAGSRNAPVPFVGTLGPMTTVPISAPPAPAPAPVTAPATGGHVTPVMLIAQTKPAYPVELQRAGVAGTVRMQAVISKEGLVNDLKASGSPDEGLARAAMEAVWKWQYRPALLDGEPIEVITTIDVNYSLKD